MQTSSQPHLPALPLADTSMSCSKELALPNTPHSRVVQGDPAPQKQHTVWHKVPSNTSIVQHTRNTATNHGDSACVFYGGGAFQMVCPQLLLVACMKQQAAEGASWRLRRWQGFVRQMKCIRQMRCGCLVVEKRMADRANGGRAWNTADGVQGGGEGGVLWGAVRCGAVRHLSRVVRFTYSCYRQWTERLTVGGGAGGGWGEGGLGSGGESERKQTRCSLGSIALLSKHKGTQREGNGWGEWVFRGFRASLAHASLL